MVRRCAFRLCFFMASRASAYWLVDCDWADFFSDFPLVSDPEFGSELSAAALIFFSLMDFLADERPALSAILPNTAGNGQSLIRSANKVAGQEAHGRHVIFTGVSTLVTG